jgi:hypothetical protein
MLLLPFLVIKARPLRASAGWLPAPVKSLGSGNKGRHASYFKGGDPPALSQFECLAGSSFCGDRKSLQTNQSRQQQN